MEERIINIGTRLKQRRKEMHIKQTEMAKELGVSQTYLSNIEGGKANCSITLLVDICNYLNVTPDYLMLGNMRGNKASIDIIDALKMCDPGRTGHNKENSRCICYEKGGAVLN